MSMIYVERQVLDEEQASSLPAVGSESKNIYRHKRLCCQKGQKATRKKSNLHSIIEKRVFSKYAGIWANVENIHESERIVVEL